MSQEGSLNSTEEWLAFKRQVDLLYPAFFDALEARIALRPEKTKLCALIILDAGTQEICDRLGMSKHAVHLARISLADRFGLAAVSELQPFLRSLAKPVPAHPSNEQGTPNIAKDGGATIKEIRDLQAALKQARELTSRIQANASNLFSEFDKPRRGRG